MTRNRTTDGDASPPPFRPVRTRARHDGWNPERQVAFIDALAGSGCVVEACRTVGMSRSQAYALRIRPDATQFRLAWDIALDMAIRRLTDACYARAIEGEPIPHYYRGEQIGEHRRYDNRLAMFLLRYRDPLRYAASLDQMGYQGDHERAGLLLARARHAVQVEAEGGTGAEIDPDAAPWTAQPLADRVAEERLAALVDSNAPIHGSTERRARIEGLRARQWAERRAAADAAANAADDLDDDDLDDDALDDDDADLLDDTDDAPRGGGTGG